MKSAKIVFLLIISFFFQFGQAKDPSLLIKEIVDEASAILSKDLIKRRKNNKT